MMGFKCIIKRAKQVKPKDKQKSISRLILFHSILNITYASIDDTRALNQVNHSLCYQFFKYHTVYHPHSRGIMMFLLTWIGEGRKRAEEVNGERCQPSFPEQPLQQPVKWCGAAFKPLQTQLVLQSTLIPRRVNSGGWWLLLTLIHRYH